MKYNNFIWFGFIEYSITYIVFLGFFIYSILTMKLYYNFISLVSVIGGWYAVQFTFTKQGRYLIWKEHELEKEMKK